jgi:hypothetical protein
MRFYLVLVYYNVVKSYLNIILTTIILSLLLSNLFYIKTKLSISLLANIV